MSRNLGSTLPRGNMNQRIYILGEGQEAGPFTQEEVQRLLSEGRLQSDTPARFEDGATWATLNDLLARMEAVPNGLPNLLPLPPPPRFSPVQAPTPAGVVAGSSPDQMTEGPPAPPGIPPPPPPRPPRSRWGWVKWAVLALLGAIAYAAYPYYVVYSLGRAIKNGRAEVLAKRINFAAVTSTLPSELAHRLNVTNQSNLEPVPAVTQVSELAFLEQIVQDYLKDADGLLRLLGHAGSTVSLPSRVRAEEGPPTPGPAPSAGSESKVTVTRASCGYLGLPFPASLSEFSVTLKDVAINCELVTPNYFPDQPWELRLEVPRLQVVLQLRTNTWQLTRLRLPQSITGLAFAPWLDPDELAGVWRVEDRLELDLEVMPAGNGEPRLPSGAQARGTLYRAQADGSLTATVFRLSRRSANELRLEPSRGPGRIRATVTKNRDGKYLLALPDEQPTPIIKTNLLMALAQLEGIWQPAGGGLEKLELYSDGSGALQGTAKAIAAARRVEYELTSSQMSGRTLNLDVRSGLGQAPAKWSIVMRPDGTFYVAPGPANELRYYRLTNRHPFPPIPAEQLAGKWETDDFDLVEFVVTGKALDRASFHPRRGAPRPMGTITARPAGRKAIPLDWTYLAAKGTGLLEPLEDNQWRLRLELTDTGLTDHSPGLPTPAVPPPARSQTAADLRAAAQAKAAFERRYTAGRGTLPAPPVVPVAPPPGRAVHRPQAEGPRELFADGKWHLLRLFGTTPHVLNVICENIPADADRLVRVEPRDKAGKSGGPSPLELRYPYGAVVQLTAPKPPSGYSFAGWTQDGVGEDLGTNQTLATALDQDKTLRATYREEAPQRIPSPWVGTWEAERFGEVKVNERGTVLNIFYYTTRSRGVILPNSSPASDDLTAKWKELNDIKGDLELTLSSDRNSFKGRWRYAGASEWSDISGRRTAR